MCRAMEEMRNETARETSLETAKNLFLIGKLTYEEIAQATKLTVEEVKELDISIFYIFHRILMHPAVKY